MAQTSDLLFQILRSELKQEKTENVPLGGLSNEAQIALLRFAKAQDLSHIVAQVFQRERLTVTGELAAVCAKEINKATYRFVLLQSAYAQICDLLERAEIPFIPLKGAVLRAFYPDPFMRTSCDIDILVHEEDLTRAIAAFKEQLNYTEGERWQHDISLFSPAGVHLELHFKLIEYDRQVEQILSQVWEQAATEEGKRYHLHMTPELFILYHIAHMAKHFVHGGCGVRPFMDLWVIRERIAFDSEVLGTMLQECGLRTFYDQSMRLTDVWFGDRAYDEITRSMEEYLLKAGIYGSLENHVQITQAKTGGKHKRLFSRIFLKYDLLKLRYPVLQKHKILTPFYQIVRWCTVLRGDGLKKARREMEISSSVEEGQQEKIKHLLNDLGMMENEMI